MYVKSSLLCRQKDAFYQDLKSIASWTSELWSEILSLIFSALNKISSLLLMYIINSFQRKGDTSKVIKICISFFCLVHIRKISLKLSVVLPVAKMKLVKKIQICPSSYCGSNLCSQKLSVACRQIFLWQACISKNFNMVISWGHLQKNKGWCQEWHWVQRNNSAWPHWFVLHGANTEFRGKGW